MTDEALDGSRLTTSRDPVGQGRSFIFSARQVGLAAALFVLSNVASVVITDLVHRSGKYVGEYLTAGRAQEEVFCTFANESSVRVSDDKFRIEEVDGPSYFPSVCTDRQTVNRGDTITYGFRITNNGNEDLPGFLITNNLPNGVVYVQGSGYTKTDTEDKVVIGDNWMSTGANLGGLKKGESKIIFFQARVNNDVFDGQILENTGQFQRLDLTGWIQCAVTTTVKIPLG